MKPLTAETIAAWSGGSVIQGAAAGITVVSTDTRALGPGSLFVALAGERFDAHAFLDQAVAAGASALLVSNDGPWPDGVAVIKTADTLQGLQKLSAAWRSEWGGTVVGLTGSNGKTSTKDLTTAILSQRWQTSATKGNLNNHIGCPLTILSTEPTDQVAVVEMGMNHPGEIAPLAAISRPNVAIITNVGTAHIEYMGSREAIALEKGMLAEAVDATGCVVLNANDDFTPAITTRCRGRVLTAGIEAGDIRITDLRTSAAGSTFTLHLPDGESAPVHLPIPGRHMAGNAALAAAAAHYLGMRIEEIVAGLTGATLNKGRLQFRSIAGLTLLDDSYNANPDSMQAALETLAGITCTGRRIAVLGRMGELGDHSVAAHHRLGQQVQAHGFTCAVVLSGDAAHIAAGFTADGGTTLHTFSDHASCAAWLQSSAHPQDVILLKGSRSAAMERIADHLST